MNNFPRLEGFTTMNTMKTKPATRGFSRNIPVVARSLLIAALCLLRQTVAAGWTPLAHPLTNGINGMLLLSDGTVIGQNPGSNAWFKLTPALNGSYVNGAWSRIANMHDTRRYFSTIVLKDGRVFVAGGEFGSGAATAEIYDPVTDAWTYINPPTNLLDPSAISPGNSQNQSFSDSNAKILPDGRVMIQPSYPGTSTTLIYDPLANAWSAGPYLSSDYESSWVKLPDDSILTIKSGSLFTLRYLPATNLWVTDADMKNFLWASVQNAYPEIGPAFLLADGTAIFMGGNGLTAIYTPSGNNNNGSWAAGTNMPGGLGMPDAPGAVMVNGKILCAIGPLPAGMTFPAPTSFCEYDPSSKTFAPVLAPGGGTNDNVPPYQTAMLDLPDGTVLFSDGGRQLYVYAPAGSPLASGKPAIQSITQNPDGSLHLAGTLFNGISEGAAYGDDLQMNSNYPLVRFTDGGGNVFYGRTYNWSSTSVQTGARVLTTECAAPPNLLGGTYSLQVVANGIASDPVNYIGPVWADFNSVAVTQNGSFNYPYHSLAAAVAAVNSGGLINIKSGNSSEHMTISKPMTISSVNGPSTIGL
jgi:hypothetical protein